MRVVNPNPVGLIATHAALTSGIHGVTGVVCGLTDTQILTNKTIGAGGLTFDNESSGANPVFTSNSSLQLLSIAGYIAGTQQLWWKSGTSYYGKLLHAVSANRTFTFPDVTGNVLVDNAVTQIAVMAQLQIKNVGAGDNPILASNSASQDLALTGRIIASSDLRTSRDLQFLSDTAFIGVISHSISAQRVWAFPDIAGTVCMWDAANAAVTRLYSISPIEICLARDVAGTAFTWEYDTANRWAQSVTQDVCGLGIHLPHGAIVTGFRVYCQEIGTANLNVTLYDQNAVGGAPRPMATITAGASLVEVADVAIDYATIDNDTYSYYINLSHTTDNAETRISKIQIDYTVTAPQP